MATGLVAIILDTMSAVADGVDVWARQSRATSASPRPKVASTDAELSVGRDGVGREQDAGSLWEDHVLHDTAMRASRLSTPLWSR